MSEQTLANPYLICGECTRRAKGFHDPEKCGCSGDFRIVPCDHAAATLDTCPSWSAPVTGSCRARHSSDAGGPVVTAPAGSEVAGLVLSAEERKFVHALHATPINPTADGCPLCVVEVRVLTRIVAARVEAARAEERERMRRWLDDHAEELVLEAAIRIAEGSQEASNGPVSAGDAGDGQRLIDDCDRQRPLGPGGKHGDRHTPTCGCDT